jgi:hypothetical protein
MTEQEIFLLVHKKYRLRNHNLHLWAVGDHEYLVRAVTRTTGHNRFYRVSVAGNVTIVASTTSGLLLHKSAPKSYRNALRLLLEQFALDFKSTAALYDEGTQLSLTPLAYKVAGWRKN